MSVCQNCNRPAGDLESTIQCDGCSQSLHLSCVGLTAKPTRSKKLNLRAYCNKCAIQADQFKSLQQMFETMRNDFLKMQEQITSLEAKIANNNTPSISPCFKEDIITEAVERLSRRKNIILHGLPEITGDSSTLLEHDKVKIGQIISITAGDSNNAPLSILRLGKTVVAGKARPVKVAFAHEITAQKILRNKNKLIGTVYANVTIYNDKTPWEQKYLADLRTELGTRNQGGDAFTIKYVKGTPTIVEKN